MCSLRKLDLYLSLTHHKLSSQDRVCLPRWLIRLPQKCFKVLTGFSKESFSHEFRVLYRYYLINLHRILRKKTTGIITARHMEQQIIERSTALFGFMVRQSWGWAHVEVQRELSMCSENRLPVWPHWCGKSHQVGYKGTYPSLTNTGKKKRLVRNRILRRYENHIYFSSCFLMWFKPVADAFMELENPRGCKLSDLAKWSYSSTILSWSEWALWNNDGIWNWSINFYSEKKSCYSMSVWTGDVYRCVTNKHHFIMLLYYVNFCSFLLA